MADNTNIIKCPSCGHENAPYVDKCILCDYPFNRHKRPSQEMQNKKIDSRNKQLGPLPESSLLIDKHKKKRESSQIMYCGECGTANRAGTLMCSNCGARLPDTVPPLNPDRLEDTQQDIPELSDDSDTQSVPEPHIEVHHAREIPVLRSPQIMEDKMVDIPPGCIKFMPWMILHLNIIGLDTPIAIRPLEDKPLLIGRRHESLPVQPHIDLTPYLDEKHGVSRRHALLRLRGNRLELQDLNSTNGTSINGVRFSPKESHQLRHDDIIQLGQVQIRIVFAQRVLSSTFGNTEHLVE